MIEEMKLDGAAGFIAKWPIYFSHCCVDYLQFILLFSANLISLFSSIRYIKATMSSETKELSGKVQKTIINQYFF
jgi:hypothetical protein